MWAEVENVNFVFIIKFRLSFDINFYLCHTNNQVMASRKSNPKPTSPKKPKEQNSYDLLWKDIITSQIADFIEFFRPDLYPKIDFSEAPKFLDQELQRVLSSLKRKGIRYCDKLVQCKLLNGNKRWIFIHIEIQRDDRPLFEKRMLVYFYRILDKYGIEQNEIESIGVYIGDGKPPKNEFTYSCGETGIKFWFRLYNLFAASEEELLATKNPFADAVLASRYALQYKNNIKQLAALKLKLTELLLQKNYPQETISNILKFVVILITLPEEEEDIYQKYLVELINPEQDMTALEKKTRKYFLPIVHQLYRNELEELEKEKVTALTEKEHALTEKERALTENKREKELAISRLFANNVPMKVIADTYNTSEETVLMIIEKSKQNN